MALKQSRLSQLQDQLSDFVETFSESFGRSERRHWCKMYLSGLLLDGERKSIQPMAARLDGGNEQALQQFVKDSPWNSRTVQRQLYDLVSQRLIGRRKSRDLILDDTGLPKKGKASVGVARQYCGATGKIDNCQSVVSWHCSSGDYHFPVVAQLYLPESWTSDTQRMDKVGIPDDARVFKEKWRLALALLDDIADETIDTLLFDAGYGANRVFLKALDKDSILL